jgi:hypothetical protein
MEYPRLYPIRRKLIATAIAAAGSMPNLTVAGICAAAMVFALAIATPASAQITIQFGGPQVPGFSNNYPWFNDVPQYQGDQSFRYFLAYHRTSRGHSHGIRACSTTPIGARIIRRWNNTWRTILTNGRP